MASNRLPALGLLWLPLLAVAQGQAIEEDLDLAYGDAATISIATGSAQTLRRAPAVATVITAQDIAALGATDLDQVLESVPGMHIAVNPINYASIYVMRGLYGQPTNPKLLLMIDGVPVRSAYSGDKGANWMGLPLEHVARIEIIRGPGSALYGADAMAGVINVISKGADELDGTELGLRGGAFRSTEVWVQHGGRWGPLRVAAYLRSGSTDGQRERIEADAATRLDRLFGTHASLAPGPVNTGHDGLDTGLDLSLGRWRLRQSLQLRVDGGTGAGVNSALDPASVINSRRHVLDLSWSEAALSPALGVGAAFTVVRAQEGTPGGIVLFPPGTRIGANVFADGMRGGPSRKERSYRLAMFANYTGFSGHVLRLGLGHEDSILYDSATFKNFLLNAAGVPIPTGPVIDYNAIQPHIPNVGRRNQHVFVQDEWQLGQDWALTLGLRHDRYSDFGGTTNPRLALVWDAAYNLTAKLLYGQAFRAPAFNEQYTVNPVATGNPQLKPERIRTTELALDWQISRQQQLRLSLFRYTLNDLIRVQPNPPPATGSTYRNQGGLKGQGFELEGLWDLSRQLRLSAQWSQQRSEDPLSGIAPGQAPNRHLFARLDWRPWQDWQLGAQLNAVGQRLRSAGDPRPPLAGYHNVDLSLQGPAATKGLSWSAALRNLFNADRREPSPTGGAIPGDLPLARRSWSVEARYRF